MPSIVDFKVADNLQFAYKPLVTRLIRDMQARRSQGWIVADGLDVLVEQGIAQFELFTNRPAPSHIMRHTVREQYFIAQNAQRDDESADTD